METSNSSDQPTQLNEYVTWVLNTHLKAGRLQYAYLLLLCLSYGIVSMHTYSNMFISQSPEWCDGDYEDYDDYEDYEYGCFSLTEESNCSVPLDQWILSDSDGYSIVGDFKLICSRHSMTPALGSFYFGGFAVGVLMCGAASDAFGRRWTYLFAFVVLAAGGFLAAAAPSYLYFAAARTALGFGVAGCGLVSFVWCTEFLDESLRPMMAWLPNVMYSIGQILVSPLAYFIPQWRYFLFAVSLISSVGLLYWPFLKESPRWLASKGLSSEAYDVLSSMATYNGQKQPPAPETNYDFHKLTDGSDEDSEDNANSGPSIWTQLLDKRLRLRFIAMCLSWFSISFAFYGVGLFSPNLPFSMYVANVINALVAVPFYLISKVMIEAKCCGRKGAVVGGFLSAGACLVASTCVKHSAVCMLLYFVANGALSLAFGIIYVWAAELFPTDIRSRSMSFQSVFGRFGAIMSAYVVDIGASNPSLALLIFAAPCVISGIVDLSLPETRGEQLPDTLSGVAGEESGLEEKGAKALYSQGLLQMKGRKASVMRLT